MSKHINYGRPWWEVMKEVSEENTRLKAEVDLLKHKLGRLLGEQQEWVLIEPEEYHRLKAEVERLRKAIMDSVEMRQRLRKIEEGKPTSNE